MMTEVAAPAKPTAQDMIVVVGWKSCATIKTSPDFSRSSPECSAPEHLIAGLGNEPVAGYLHLEPPFGNGYQFVAAAATITPRQFVCARMR
jgi:hypothetical protein